MPGAQNITVHALPRPFESCHLNDLSHCLEDGASAPGRFVAVETRMEKNLKKSALQATTNVAQGKPKCLSSGIPQPRQCAGHVGRMRRLTWHTDRCFLLAECRCHASGQRHAPYISWVRAETLPAVGGAAPETVGVVPHATREGGFPCERGLRRCAAACGG